MTRSILKISEAAAIAIHAMVILTNNPEKLMSVKDISTILDISANHLSKVMQRLNKAGYINSIKGFNGGFKLAQDPTQITFLDIFELLDGKLQYSECMFTKKKCGADCVLGDLISSINKQVEDKFKGTKLSDCKR